MQHLALIALLAGAVDRHEPTLRVLIDFTQQFVRIGGMVLLSIRMPQTLQLINCQSQSFLALSKMTYSDRITSVMAMPT